MNTLLHPVVVFTLSLPLLVVCQSPVSVQVNQSPVLVASGNDAVFTVQTVNSTSLIRWIYSSNSTLAMWVNGGPTVVSVPQFQGRISVTATQLKISSSQVKDSGNYTVSVEPSSSSGLSVNTASVQLKVLDAVSGVSLSLPPLPLEGGNMSLSCLWTAGSEVSVVWDKGGTALSSDTRITISGGSMLIHPARRDDAGVYSCTAKNTISAQTAKATLNVYYGPDSPQMNKTSNQCVGGGDATIGQTVQLTCTSNSLPPASFSWALNGQPLTSGQSGSGVLSLQIFSTNQNGLYSCTAQNDITGGTSKQQISLVIVGTCLSGGAVAGIVVACFVVLIIIIIIILLVRQRNVDRRLRDTIGRQKTNQNESTTIANRAVVNENHPDLISHNSLPQNFTAIPNNNNGNINTMAQNMPSYPLHQNGHLNTNAFQHNFNAVPDNGHQNNNSYPNNEPQRSFPQHNPNILIQTGNSQAGARAPTVHLTLNTLPHNDPLNTQPQTVHVNLNTYPPEPNQVVQQHAEQRGSAPHSQHANTNHHNISQAGLMNSDPNQTQTILNHALPNDSHQSNGLIATNYLHHTDANHRTANLRSSGERQTRRSNRTRSNPRFSDTNPHPQQIPWDRLRGTPSYPNREVDTSDTSGSSDWQSRSPQREERRGRSGQRHSETEPSESSTHETSVSQRRDPQRPVMPIHPNVQNQVLQQNQIQSQIPRQPLPQTQTSQVQNPMHIAQPWGHPIPQAYPQAQTVRPDVIPTQPSVPLTQAALLEHTAQNNPFANRNQQTLAALQNPGPSQPIQKLNKAGHKPPTPPPVLQPDEFQMLPRGRMEQPHNVQPVNVMRKHRSTNKHRQTRVWHTSPQRMPVMHPMHPIMHGHPMHMQQVHRGRPRR